MNEIYHLSVGSNLRNTITCLVCMTVFVAASLAQEPTIQDCLGAIAICTQIYEETDAPVGAGNYQQEINGTSNNGISCMDQELNSIWYTFTVNKSGNFGFELIPNDLNDDYDWALFDITSASCSEIFSDQSLQVSCNAAGGFDLSGNTCHGVTGATGQSNFTNQGGGCGFNPPDQFGGNNPFNALVPVELGNTYVLVVSNWTGSTNGYKIDFGLSDGIDIFDDMPPEVLGIELDISCGAGSIVVPFSENIQTGTIGKANFELIGPGGAVDFDLTSEAFAVGGAQDKTFKLVLDPPLSEPGSYTLSIKRHSDVDILDLCGNQLVNEPAPISFEVDEVGPVPFSLGNDTTICVDEAIRFDVTDKNATSYQWQDGDNSPIRDISAAGTYSVTISNSCSEFTDEIAIDFANCSVCNVYIPSAITPNGDGLNDDLSIFSDCALQKLNLQVFDRWGNLLHEGNDILATWDGRVKGESARTGVFIYKVEYQVQELGEVFTKSITETERQAADRETSTDHRWWKEDPN